MPAALSKDPLAESAVSAAAQRTEPETPGPDGPPPFPPPNAPRAVEADAALAIPPHPSPAREMIAGLEQALTLPEAEDEALIRWPPRRTLVFVLVTCGAFWAGVAAALGLVI